MPSDADALIDRLATDLAPVRPRSAARDLALVAVLALAELGLFLLAGYMRPDMGLMLGEPAMWWKLASFAALAIAAGAATVAALDPTRDAGPALRLVVALALVAVATGWLIDAAAAGPAALAARLNWREGLHCLGATTLLALPPLIALGLLLRRGAPTRPRSTALAAGLAAAAWGAFVFVFNCPHDDPLYTLVWFSLSIALIALGARLILPPLTRW